MAFHGNAQAREICSCLLQAEALIDCRTLPSVLYPWSGWRDQAFEKKTCTGDPLLYHLVFDCQASSGCNLDSLIS